MSGVVQISIKLHSLNSFYIPSWPGVFAAKIIYDTLSQVGVKIAKREEKTFSLTPIRTCNDGFRLAGIYPSTNCSKNRWLYVEENGSIMFEIYTASIDLAKKIILGFTRNPTIQQPCGKFEVASIQGTLIPIKVIKIPSFCGPWMNARLQVEFLTPTRFMMRGWCINYPSPIRFFRSAAKSYYVVTGIDVRSTINHLILSNIELLGSCDKIKQCYVDIGHEGNERRVIKAFYGESEYILHIREDMLTFIEQLLRAAEVLGIGVNKALGFGRVRINISRI